MRNPRWKRGNHVNPLNPLNMEKEPLNRVSSLNVMMKSGLFGAASGLAAFGMYQHKLPVLKIYEDKDNPSKWRWNIKFSSDIVGATSQGYSSKKEAVENLLKLEQHIKQFRESGELTV